MGIGAKLSAVYRRDRHISRLILMMIVWAAFMAITRFDKFYTLINFQTMASQFPEFGLMSLGIMVCMITSGIYTYIYYREPRLHLYGHADEDHGQRGK